MCNTFLEVVGLVEVLGKSGVLVVLAELSGMFGLCNWLVQLGSDNLGI